MDWQKLRKRLTPSPFTLIILLVIAYIWFRPPAFVSDLANPAPDVVFQTLDGKPLSMDSLKGKVVLVNFWATWCPYCLKEMPAMDEFYRDYKDKGFVVLALSTDESEQAVREYMKGRDYSFPVAMSAGSSALFGEVKQIPTSFVIDKNGVIRHKVSGQVYYGRMKDLVEPLLTAR